MNFLYRQHGLSPTEKKKLDESQEERRVYRRTLFKGGIVGELTNEIEKGFKDKPIQPSASYAVWEKDGWKLYIIFATKEDALLGMMSIPQA